MLYCLVSMTDSLFFSMTTRYFNTNYRVHSIMIVLSSCSRQMAEEVMRGGVGQGEEQGAGFEGMEALAQAIELGILHS